LRYFIEFLFLVYFISSMTVLRDEMYTRQTHIRDRFTAKPAVVTYN
jgi:hypothetical protein